MDDRDHQFIRRIARAEVAEIELSKLAVDRAEDYAVTSFAQQLIDDHTRSNLEFKRFASDRGIMLSSAAEVPSEVSEDHQALRGRLIALTGRSFDREFVKAVLDDHEARIAEFRRELRETGDADLRELVTNTLPTLEQHVHAARELYSRSIEEPF